MLKIMHDFEWVAPESNSTKKLWLNNRHLSRMRLPN